MNCEQVFDILTRGPFPTGEAWDAHVERHLLACHDCRRLAEALRPAVELMHECVEGQEADSLPGYRGWLDEGTWLDKEVWLDEGACARERSPVAGPDRTPDAFSNPETRKQAVERPLRSPGEWGHLVRGLLPWLSLAAVIVAMAVLARSPHVPGQRPDEVITRSAVTLESRHTTPELTDSGRRLLVQLALPVACWDASSVSTRPAETKDRNLPPAAVRDLYHCCTRCHMAGAGRLDKTALWKVTQSCDACHATEGVVEASLNL